VWGADYFGYGSDTYSLTGDIKVSGYEQNDSSAFNVQTVDIGSTVVYAEITPVGSERVVYLKVEDYGGSHHGTYYLICSISSTRPSL
jgi:hypothetical protein